MTARRDGHFRKFEMSYTVKFYKGDYLNRQRAANADKAVLYVEHHFNSVESPTADYATCVVGSNAGRTSRAFAETYVRKVADAFGCKAGSILIGGYDGRGDGNVKYTDMPAALLEPLFCSNPKRAVEIKSDEGQDKLAKCLAETIRHFFPNGGLIAFSVGHKYRSSKPNDRGANVHGGGSEADYAEMVLQKTEELLTC